MSQKPPRILVGITTQNRAEVLPKAIASALSQREVELTVAVQDDASTDSTSDLISDFPTVQWNRSEKMEGYRAVRNRWMQRSEFDYFVSLDDDAWFLRIDAISIALKRFADNPRLGAVAFDILSPDDPEESTSGNPTETQMFIGCGHMLRLTAVKQAGYYDDTPGAYGGEERDLALRLLDHNFTIEFLPGIHVWHDKAWTGRDWSPLHRSGVCNELVLAVRRCPLPDLLWVLPLKLGNFLNYWIRTPARFKPGLLGLTDFMSHLGPTWASRQPVRRATYRRSRRPSL